MLSYALSEKGIMDARAYFGRSREIENRLVVAHARMDQARQRRKQLEADGREGMEKCCLLEWMEETQTAVLQDYRHLMETEKEMESTIRKVGDPTLQTVLELRYLQHWQPFAIAEKMHMDERHIYRILKKALQTAALALAQEGIIGPGLPSGRAAGQGFPPGWPEGCPGG